MIKVHQKCRGSIPILTLVLMPVLLVSVGLALDMGKFFIVKSELQNAADACALAAAYELDGLTAISFTNAEAAGIELAQQNKVLFQKNTVATPVVEFSSAIDGSYVSATSANPANDIYARCRVSEPNIPNWFLQLLPSFGNQTINAQAVASNLPGQQTCALPIGICDAGLAGKIPGDWVGGVQSAQNGTGGYFQWIDFNTPAGGANELKELLSSENTCEVSASTLNVGQFGVASGAEPHYNSRFGIYAGGVPLTAVPDNSGYAYHLSNWPSKF
ncbi:MAG TPA: pilus assembly protein TadG-related protein, partial [Methylophilaceae bacterium]|nr:pilus assembly protein TadG-related protein [Methylophilaceae bacterium]